MKKYFLLVLIFAFVFLHIPFYQKDFYNFFKNYPSAEFCYVQNKNSKNVLNDCKTLTSGSKSLIFFKNCANKKIEADYKQVLFKGNYNCLKQILKNLNAKQVFSDNSFKDKIIIYAYSSSWQKCVFVNGYKINFQFVFYNETIKVGYPMIYSGF